MNFAPSNLHRRHYTILSIFTAALLWFFYFSSDTFHSRIPPIIDASYALLKPLSPNSRYAIATFLNGDTSKSASDKDYYFTATRVLTYQLLHANETRCARKLPFLVVVTSTVTQDKRDRLTKDGAVVVAVEDVKLKWWIKSGISRWKDQFTKLRLLEMVEYDRILFIDADTILTRPIDGIFDEPEARNPVKTNFFLQSEIRGDEAQMPAEFVFSARSDNQPNGRRKHPFPPILTPGFSAGFWLAAPSKEMYEYLMSIMTHWLRFNPQGMEQSLLNYAFRRTGAMPWAELNYQWSATWPGLQDLNGGVASLHEKFWKVGPKELKTLWFSWRDRMEEFYAGT